MAIVVSGTNALCSLFNSAGSSGDSYEVKLGHFPNLTHGAAIMGIVQGLFTAALDEYGAS